MNGPILGSQVSIMVVEDHWKAIPIEFSCLLTFILMPLKIPCLSIARLFFCLGTVATN